MATCFGDCFSIPIGEASGVQKAVQKVAESSGETLSSESATFDSGWPIFRVPAHVREVDNRAYSPRIVSIGPFHHKEEALKAFEDQKERFLSRLKERITSSEVHDLENAMKEMEKKTRKCYSEKFEGIDFAQMMLLDGCFIVELLRLHYLHTPPKKTSQGPHVVKEKEPILETHWMVPNIGRDLLMLENQLPMFVLQKIYDITTIDEEATDPLNKLALRFFEPLRPVEKEKELSDDILNANRQHPHLLALFQSTFQTPKSSGTKSDNQIEYEEIPGKGWVRNAMPHLLALFQSTFCNSQGNPNASVQNQSEYDAIPGKGWVHNAKTLTYAGIRFEKNSGNILDIGYKKRVLTIPTLDIDDGTSTLLRNLIAYEQSNRSANRYVSCLAFFLDCLVDSVDDIDILRRAGIIKQAKGGDEEVKGLLILFNSLTKELEIDKDDCYIRKQIQDVNRHYYRLEVKVKIYRFLSKLTFVDFITAYLTTLLTLISILSAVKEWNGKGSESSDPSGRARRSPPTAHY